MAARVISGKTSTPYFLQDFPLTNNQKLIWRDIMANRTPKMSRRAQNIKKKLKKAVKLARKTGLRAPFL